MNRSKRRGEANSFLVRLRRPSIVAVIVGVVVFSIAYWSEGSLFVGDLSDASRDVVLSIHSGDRTPKYLRRPIIFVEIDDDTYSALGRPDTTPRAPLASLLQAIASKKPRTLIVDLDVGLPGHDSLADDQFEKTLEQIDSAGVPLLLVRRPDVRASAEAGELQRTPFDTLVGKSRSIDWVVAPALLGLDGVARRMQSWDRICAERRPKYILNAALAAALISGHLRPIKTIVREFPNPNWTCFGALPGDREAVRLPIPLLPSQHQTTVRNTELITYTLRWPAPAVSSEVITDGRGRTRPMLTVLSAKSLMIGPSPSVAESLFADSIVVIGATHRASLDEVATPIGEMPGAFALVNVVRGLADFGIEEPFSFWQNLIAAVLLAFGTAVLMTIAKHSVSRWIEALLPFAILSLWLAFLVFGLGDNLYFTMALIPIIVGAVLLLLPEQRNDGFDRVRTAHKHKGKNR